MFEFLAIVLPAQEEAWPAAIYISAIFEKFGGRKTRTPPRTSHISHLGTVQPTYMVHVYMVSLVRGSYKRAQLLVLIFL